MLDLYHFPDSPCCMKVRFVLAEKGLEWNSKLITTYKFDHFQPAYQSLNPHSMVPTLVHDDTPIIQSTAIAEYLNDRFPEPSLSPKDPMMRAKMREWLFEEQGFLFPLIVVLSFNTMMKLRAKGFGMGQLREWSRRHPDQSRAADYLERVTSPADMQAVAAAKKKITWHFERLNKQLETSGGPYICGEEFSLADIAVAPIMDRIEYLDMMDTTDTSPLVQEWFETIKARPAYQQAVPSFKDRMWGPKKPVPVM